MRGCNLESPTKSLLQILGVSRAATAREIRKAYRQLALKYHPDKQQSDDTKHAESIQQQFIEVADAYAVLSDDEARLKYDSGDVRSREAFHARFGLATLLRVQFSKASESGPEVYKYDPPIEIFAR